MTQNIVKYKNHTESEKTLLFNEKFNRNTEISLLRDDSYPIYNIKIRIYTYTCQDIHVFKLKNETYERKRSPY